jgi:hypothetical protein
VPSAIAQPETQDETGNYGAAEGKPANHAQLLKNQISSNESFISHVVSGRAVVMRVSPERLMAGKVRSSPQKILDSKEKVK